MSAPRRAVIAVSLAALALVGCEAETAPLKESAARPVQVASVSFVADVVTRDFVGVIAPRTETDLAFRVGGKMLARTVAVGDRVRAGAVIARLDAEDLILQLESAEAELAAATSALAQASADLERFDALRERGHATVADFDRKSLARDEAAARLERAGRSLDLARRQVGYAELRADVDGVIVATAAEQQRTVGLSGERSREQRRDREQQVEAHLLRDWSDRERQLYGELLDR